MQTKERIYNRSVYFQTRQLLQVLEFFIETYGWNWMGNVFAFSFWNTLHNVEVKLIFSKTTFLSEATKNIFYNVLGYYMRRVRAWALVALVRVKCDVAGSKLNGSTYCLSIPPQAMYCTSSRP